MPTLAAVAPTEPGSPASSSGASFVTATRKSSLEQPVTPTESSCEAGSDNFEIAGELDELSRSESLSGWNEQVTDIASAIFNGGPKLADELTLIPRFALEGHPAPPTPVDCLPFGNEDACLVDEKGPFQRWMQSLHRRAAYRSRQHHRSRHEFQRRFSDDGLRSLSISRSRSPSKLSSSSSLAFVTAVKTASVGLASITTRTRSRQGTTLSRDRSRTNRSSRLSESAPRYSEDSAYSSDVPPRMDPAVIERSLRRRSILEELIATEENYIGDVRFLMNVYVTILASLPSISAGFRSSINRNLTDIVELHEEILGDLHRVVPNSEYTQLDGTGEFGTGPTKSHQRWRSLDSVPEDAENMAWLHGVPGMLADPQVAEEVAKVFNKRINRFFIYKEYGAKYEIMEGDINSIQDAIPAWETFQKGLETLALSVGSQQCFDDQSRRALTLRDLLVKPVQRICKYPLLFFELSKATPVEDCPNSHMEVDNTLSRIREATAEINKVTNDGRMKSVLEKTWMLQDRLVFANQRLDAASKNRIRSFGHIRMCGALHVCWATKDEVQGQYMVCLLYPEVLCIASAGKADQIYTIQACINLASIKVEEVDNGRGLQCHTAPYSWKLVFECDYQIYEVIMTACTPKEELEWRTRLTSPPGQREISKDPSWFGWLSLDIRSLGTVFGKPGTMARRLSIHRATTINPKAPLSQVILKNTCLMRDSTHAAATASINRSQSLLTTGHRIPILAPPRAERARVEALLSDVWSRDILPFPGMTMRSRSEQLVRTSASMSSVMRKLSVASIATSFGRRQGSLASIHKSSAETDMREACGNSGRRVSTTNGDTTTQCEIPFSGESSAEAKPQGSILRDGHDIKGMPATKVPMPAASAGGRGEVEDAAQEQSTGRAAGVTGNGVAQAAAPRLSKMKSFKLKRPSVEQLPSFWKTGDQEDEKSGRKKLRRKTKMDTPGSKTIPYACKTEAPAKDRVLSGIRSLFI